MHLVEPQGHLTQRSHHTVCHKTLAGSRHLHTKPPRLPRVHALGFTESQLLPKSPLQTPKTLGVRSPTL